MRLVDGKLVEHADLSARCRYEINDMVVDARGNAYVGNIGFDLLAGEKFKPTNLVLVTAAGEVREVADDLHVPNGPVITRDGKRLVIAESWAKRLTAFDIEADGSLANRRTFAELDVAPDGEDRYPVACTLGGADGRTLYCLTFKGTIKELGRIRDASRIETARVEVPAGGSP